MCLNSMSSVSVKTVLEKSNEDNLFKIQEMLEEINQREAKKTNSMKMVVNINLWVSLLTVAIVIARILGVI